MSAVSVPGEALPAYEHPTARDLVSAQIGGPEHAPGDVLVGTYDVEKERVGSIALLALDDIEPFIADLRRASMESIRRAGWGGVDD